MRACRLFKSMLVSGSRMSIVSNDLGLSTKPRFRNHHCIASDAQLALFVAISIDMGDPLLAGSIPMPLMGMHSPLNMTSTIFSTITSSAHFRFG